MASESAIPVKVALRCRPLPSDSASSNCITFIDNTPQILIGEKSFTYDYAFPPNCKQFEIYEQAILPLVECIFKGYNATVLAYGQTGSGKTHTMGGGWGDLETMKSDPDLVGVIPRVVNAIYEGIEKSTDYKYTCRISYMEIYKETLIDLLTPRNQQSSEGVQIREDINGPKPVGLKILEVKKRDDMLTALNKGAMERTTGSTAMNSVSSRSHAIFTIYVDRISVTDQNDVCCSKFHLVDLAGSERAKRTKAEGSRFKEGVNINLGLLSLGNVISALGEEGHRHIPYRDSKLTRLLQDSLGGNSHTLMIACISPDIVNYDETLSCLRYADRARMIKNKPIVNHDPQVAENQRLKAIIAALRAGGGAQTGAAGGGGTGEEMTALKNKLNALHQLLSEKDLKINSLSTEVDQLSRELSDHIDQVLEMREKLISAHKSDDVLHQTLLDLRNMSKDSYRNGGGGDGGGGGGFSEHDHVALATMVNEIMNRSALSGDEQADEAAATAAKDELDEANKTFSDLRYIMVTTGERNDEVAKVCDTVTDSHREHALNQAKHARELNDMSSMIARKEELMRNVARHEDEERKDLLSKYEESIKEHKLELADIQSENDILSEQLKKYKDTSSDKCRKADERKHVLNQKMNVLNKKIAAQASELKVKEASVKRCALLSNEIMLIKQKRVTLMKQMKADSDTFRTWKKTKEKEVIQLRAKDRKLNLQLSKVNTAFTRQRLVMKRKTEEANSANKRLKDALHLRSKFAAERNKKFLKVEQGPSGHKIKTWLSQEMEVLISVEEAKHNLDILVQDRIEINKCITDITDNIEQPDHISKKRMLNRKGASLNTSDNKVYISQIIELKQDLEHKNNQIVEIEQRLSEVESDRSKNRWDYIKNMTESKLAMKWLMNEVVTIKVQRTIDKTENVSEINRFKTKFQSLEHNCDVLQENQRNIECSLIHITENESTTPTDDCTPPPAAKRGGLEADSSQENSLEEFQSPVTPDNENDSGPDENRQCTPLNTTYNKIKMPKRVFRPLNYNMISSDGEESNSNVLNKTFNVLNTTYNILPHKKGRRSKLHSPPTAKMDMDTTAIPE